MKKLCILLSFIFFITEILIAQKWIEVMDTATNFNTVRKAFEQEWQGKSYEKGKGFKQYKRWEYFMEPRVYPSGEFFNPMLAWTEFNEYKKKYGNGQNKNAGVWVSVGPSNWNATNGVPGIGRINVIVEAPSNSNVIYVGSASGGLWVSQNGGSSWTNLTDNQPVLGVSSIAVNPGNPNDVYIATGDGDGANTYSVGVLRTTDGGNTWNTTGLNWAVNQFRLIRQLRMHPTNPNIIFAATNVGLFRTTNAGITWVNILPFFDGQDIEFHPGNSNIIYACSDQFFRSTDGGNTFNPITNGLPAAGNINRFKIAVTPNQPNWVYVVGGKETGSAFEGVYRSTDSGASFVVRTNTPNMFGYKIDGSDLLGQSFYDMAIAVNPSNANEVFIGGINIWRSTNGGSSFTINTMWYFPPPNATGYVHADIHDLVFFGNRFYTGTDGGIYRSTNNGTNWTNLSSGLVITQFYDIAVNPYNKNILGGSQDNGTNLYSGSNTWKHIWGGDGGYSAFNPCIPNILYVSNPFGHILKSTNTGNSFLEILRPKQDYSDTAAFVSPFLLDPVDHNTLYAGLTEVYKSDNGGNTWNKISNFGFIPNVYVNVLKVAPSNNNYIYATRAASIYRTTDGGVNWANISTGLPNLFFSDIVIDPANPDRLWLTQSGYSSGLKVFYSGDGGSIWSNISVNLPNLPVNCIAYLPGSNDVLYIGMDIGIYTKDATQNNWTVCMNGLPNVIVKDIEINIDQSKIYAGSFGRGVWKMDLPLIGVSDETWVDFKYGGLLQVGTLDLPYKTLGNGVNNTDLGGIIRIKGSISPEIITIDKQCTITTITGCPSVVGQQ